MNRTQPTILRAFAVAALLAGALVARGEDLRPIGKIPSTLNMRVGEVQRFKGVNMAATGDKTVVRAEVKKNILTVKALKAGQALMFVFPPYDPKTGGEGIKAGSKKHIYVHVTP